MNRDTLIAALVGALIATIPILISNVVQIFLHMSDTRQKQREAKIQAREKWIQPDILRVMDLIEKITVLLDEADNLQPNFNHLLDGKNSGIISRKEYLAKRKEAFDRYPIIYNEIYETSSRMSKLIYSFEDESLISAYEQFANSVTVLVNTHTGQIQNETKGEPVQEDALDEIWSLVNRDSGKFHKILRDKLILLRE